MKCPNCGTENMEDANFCANCGQSIQTDENNSIEESTNEEIHDIESEEVAQDAINNDIDDDSDSQEKQEVITNETQKDSEKSTDKSNFPLFLVKIQEKVKNKDKKYIAGTGIVAILVIILLIVGIYNLSNLLKGPTQIINVDKAPILFVDDEDLYMLYPGDDESIELIKDFNREGRLVAIDENAFYYSEDDTLYHRKGKKDPIKIMDDVIDFTPSKDGSAVLITDTDHKLYYYHGKEPVEICNEKVEPGFNQISENGKFFAFTFHDDSDLVLGLSKGEEYEEVNIDIDDETLSQIFLVNKNYAFYSTYQYDDGVSIVYRATLDGEEEELFEYDGMNLIMSEDGKKAVYVNEESELYYYNGEESKEIDDDIIGIYTLSMNMSYQNSLGYSSSVQDGSKVFVIDDRNRLYYYEFGKEELIEVEDSDDAVAVDWSEDGTTILLSTMDELVLLKLSGDEFKVEEIDIEDIVNIYLRSDGKQAILEDDDATYYAYQVGKDKAVRISKDVEDWDTNPDYVKVLIQDEDDEAYYYNGKDTVQVGEDVKGSLTLVKNGKEYYFRDYDNTLLYGEKGKEVEEVAKDIVDMMTYNDKDIYLINDDDEMLYYKLGDEDAQELNFDADEFYSIYQFLVY